MPCEPPTSSTRPYSPLWLSGFRGGSEGRVVSEFIDAGARMMPRISSLQAFLQFFTLHQQVLEFGHATEIALTFFVRDDHTFQKTDSASQVRAEYAKLSRRQARRIRAK